MAAKTAGTKTSEAKGKESPAALSTQQTKEEKDDKEETPQNVIKPDIPGVTVEECQKCGRTEAGHKGDGDFAGVFYCENCWTTWTYIEKNEKLEAEMFGLRAESEQLKEEVARLSARMEVDEVSHENKQLREQVKKLTQRVEAAEVKMQRESPQVMELWQSKQNLGENTPRNKRLGAAPALGGLQSSYLETDQEDDDAQSSQSTEVPPLSAGGGTTDRCSALSIRSAGEDETIWTLWLTSLRKSCMCANRSSLD